MRGVLKSVIAVALMVPFILLSQAFAADDEPDATLTFETKKVGAVFGVQWGTGVLTLKDGTEYKFKVDGGKLITAGYTKVSATGKVFGLMQVQDFNGRYGMLGAGGAFVKGGHVAVLENEETKVKVHLTAKQKGVEIDLGAGGIGFKLEE